LGLRESRRPIARFVIILLVIRRARVIIALFGSENVLCGDGRAWSLAYVNFTDRGEPEQVDAEIASHGYFDVLRVTATRGRVLAADDERADAPGIAADAGTVDYL